MKFNAKIESVDTTNKQLTIEYFDPHGGESLRLSVSYKFNTTIEELKEIIIGYTPHKYFHDRNEELNELNASEEKKTNQEVIKSLTGESFEYNLPSFDNEVI
jgi:hypothetical protein